MFGLPIWAIELIISLLSELGFFNLAQKLAAKLAVKTATIIKETKTYSDYNIHKNNEAVPDTYMKSENNINKG
jgi:hypothetical protein